jgi:putative DNA primase/helicase
MMTSPSETAGGPLTDFLAALFDGCEGFMEFRALPSTARADRLFALIAAQPPRIITPWLAAHVSQDLYLGVSSRRNQLAGDLAHCQHLGALFVDVDFKATPEPEARARVARCPLPPSAVVQSGGGLHVYWFLREPLLLPDEAERAKHLLRRLALATGGDPASAEPARILRVPGTRNHKPEYGTPRLVVIEQLDPTRRCNPSELEPWLPEEPMVEARRGPFTMPDKVLEGTRNDTLWSLARSLKTRNLGLPAMLAALEAENAEKCDPPLPARDLADIAQHAMSHPDRPRPGLPPQPAGALAAGPVDALAPGEEPLTDAGNARQFAREHGADVRYCYAWRTWLVWDGQRWARDPGDQMAQRAKATARRRLRDAAILPDEPARKAAVRHALYSESARGLQAMVALAQSEPGIPVAAEVLDVHAFLLNTPSGTVELGPVPHLRPARREDYLTKLTAVPYVAEARHSMLDRFLSDMLPDAETREYVQRAAGYSCTGSQAEEVLFLIRGRTAAGKTTLQEALKHALGDYALAADFETFTVRKDAHGPREDLVRLKGARIVTTSETRARRLDEGMVKRVTGGDTLAGRRLYENTEEFQGTFKLWLAGNERPVVSGDDDAIWRRIREIPFPRSLTAGERDPAVKAALTDPAGAGPAVLAWALAGCAAWCQRRDAGHPALAEPAAVVDATADYRGVMDMVAAFLAAACILEADAWVSRAELREALERWGKEEGLPTVPSGRTVGRGLRERGVVDNGRGGRRGWRGVRVRGPSDPDPEPQADAAVETIPAW